MFGSCFRTPAVILFQILATGVKLGDLSEALPESTGDQSWQLVLWITPWTTESGDPDDPPEHRWNTGNIVNNTGNIVDNLFLNPLGNKLSTMLPVFHDKASDGSSGSPLSSGDSSVVRSPDSWFERSCVRVPAGAEGGCYSPGSTFCADLLGIAPPPCYRNST